MFELDGVDVVKGGRRVLSNVSLRLGAGERLALVGPSGGGKSTLLRLLVGLDVAAKGEVRFQGRSMDVEVDGASLAHVRAQVGYVIQEGGLFPHLSARDNAALPARHRGWEPGRTSARIDELAELTHLDPNLLGRLPGQLSGGQRQRVALMRALLTDPEVLLLDEPLGALDPVTRHGLQDDLLSIFDQLGKTVLLVSHDLPEATYLATRLAIIDGGEILQEGSYAELVGAPADDRVRTLLSAVRGLPQATLDGEAP